ncbi:uncharacterized protein LOC123397960 [Hordeum vulgare subsp. vulgare]|uniref:Predicted protein n=1 Tax=Hordeum vulgare subsp. vulgare TaxID=112509 RepID=F2DX22_HORVV|nr:uncharacterized protein LOC123397960 [Hordeum vulgare subsp. vulgare]BAJ99643.1 predicted protein [Hordeum vulgare subsp. vulgare]
MRRGRCRLGRHRAQVGRGKQRRMCDGRWPSLLPCCDPRRRAVLLRQRRLVRSPEGVAAAYQPRAMASDADEPEGFAAAVEGRCRAPTKRLGRAWGARLGRALLRCWLPWPRPVPSALDGAAGFRRA